MGLSLLCLLFCRLIHEPFCFTLWIERFRAGRLLHYSSCLEVSYCLVRAQKHSCTWKLSEYKIANGGLQLYSKQIDYSLSFFQKIPQPCGLLLRYRKACIAPSYESFGLGSQLVFHSDSACQLRRFTELSHHRKTEVSPAEAVLFYLILDTFMLTFHVYYYSPIAACYHKSQW